MHNQLAASVPVAARPQTAAAEPTLLSLPAIAPFFAEEGGRRLSPEEKLDLYAEYILWTPLSPAVMGLNSPTSGNAYYLTNHPKWGVQCSCQGGCRKRGQHVCWHVQAFFRAWGGIVSLVPMQEVQA